MNKDLTVGLVWGGGAIALALAATVARKLGYLDPETVTRLVIGFNGLMVAWYGNRMPKSFVPSAAARQVRRVGGWSITVSGLVYATLWAFAPIPVAIAAGCGALVTAMVVTFSYCLSLRAKAKAA
jgi:hypothetical protein